MQGGLTLFLIDFCYIEEKSNMLDIFQAIHRRAIWVDSRAGLAYPRVTGTGCHDVTRQSGARGFKHDEINNNRCR
jgi:hypothetical protein